MKFMGPVMAAASLVLLSAPLATATETVGWLGNGTAHYPAGIATGEWSTQQGSGWSVALPDWGNSSPVVFGDRIFVTAEPSTLMAISVHKGRVLWRRDITYADTVTPAQRATFKARLAKSDKLTKRLKEAELTYSRLRRDARKARGDKKSAQTKLEEADKLVSKLTAELAPYEDLRPPLPIPDLGSASATPVTDGESVYAVFGNGVVTACGTDGSPRWSRFLGKPALPMRGYDRGQAASPLLVDGVLVVAMNKLFGLDPKTGETRWTGSDYSEFGAPTPATLSDGKRYLVTPGGDVIRARDGHVAARGIGLVFFVSPGVDGDRVYFVGADQNPGSLVRSATALRLTVRGDRVTATELWRSKLKSQRTFTCPVMHAGILYALGDRSTLSAVKLSDGSILYEETLALGDDAAYATPVIAGDTLVATGLGGKLSVVRLGATFEALGTHEVEGGRATPTFAGTDLVLRGLQKLWLIRTGASSGAARR